MILKDTKGMLDMLTRLKGGLRIALLQAKGIRKEVSVRGVSDDYFIGLISPVSSITTGYP